MINTENPHKFTHYAVKQVNKTSNKVHSKVKHNSLELSCSLYSQVQVLVSCVPSSTMFSASLLYVCVDPLFLLEQVFNSTQKRFAYVPTCRNSCNHIISESAFHPNGFLCCFDLIPFFYVILFCLVMLTAN